MKVFKFYADWCGQCRVLDEFLKNKCVNYTNIDADDEINEELLNKYNITNLPTLIAVDNKENEFKRHVGMMSEDEFNTFFYDIH